MNKIKKINALTNFPMSKINDFEVSQKQTRHNPLFFKSSDENGETIKNKMKRNKLLCGVCPECKKDV